MHAIGHDDFVGQSQTPWFHGMLGAEMHPLHFWVGMIRDIVAFGPIDFFIQYRPLAFLVESKSLCGSWTRMLIILDKRSLYHVER